MTAGIDIGITTTKIDGLDGEILRGFCEVPASDPVASASGALGRLLNDQRLPLSAIRRQAITGIGAHALGEELLGVLCQRIDEFQATGRGGLHLAGLAEAIVVSMGTDTSIVRASPDGVRHMGGSGVGGGTLLWLANVDLRISDILPSNLGSLPGQATASYFGRLSGRASRGDNALGILNLVFQTIGILASFAARQEGFRDVVLAGRLAAIPQARDIFAGFADLYPLTFHFPENPEQATAVGAALTN
jgi:type II pantothenate kinase